jgi:hypothetical protein
MRVLIIGLTHDVQWNDPTGDLKRLLEGQLRNLGLNLLPRKLTSCQQLWCSDLRVA